MYLCRNRASRKFKVSTLLKGLERDKLVLPPEVKRIVMNYNAKAGKRHASARQFHRLRTPVIRYHNPDADLVLNRNEDPASCERPSITVEYDDGSSKILYTSPFIQQELWGQFKEVIDEGKDALEVQSEKRALVRERGYDDVEFFGIDPNASRTEAGKEIVEDEDEQDKEPLTATDWHTAKPVAPEDMDWRSRRLVEKEQARIEEVSKSKQTAGTEQEPTEEVSKSKETGEKVQAPIEEINKSKQAAEE